MTQRSLHSQWWIVGVALGAALVFAGTTAAQQAKSAAEGKQSKSSAEAKASTEAKASSEEKSSSQEPSGPVVRTYGTKGGYQTEVTSETKGTLNEEDRRQISLLGAQVFQHISEARRAIDADDLKLAHKEVDQARGAIKVIRAMLPTTSVHTKTTGPDGKVVYEDQREVREHQVPLFEGMLSAKTLAPIVAAKQDVATKPGKQEKNGEAREDASEISGVRVVSSETITTEVFADLNVVEAQLRRVAKALDADKADDAAEALALAQVQGVELRYNREDTPLAEARDAMWLAKRSLEENNATQARANLRVARQSLRLYREIAPEKRWKDIDQMLREVDELEGKLGRESEQHRASSGERSQQGKAATAWWERINEWFRRR